MSACVPARNVCSRTSPKACFPRVTLHRSVQRRIQVDRERTRLIGLHSVPEGFGVTPGAAFSSSTRPPSNCSGTALSTCWDVGRMNVFIPSMPAVANPRLRGSVFLQQAYLLEDELREWRTLFSRADGSLFLVNATSRRWGKAAMKDLSWFS